MKQPFISDPSEALHNIKKVDAPPFMLTRIMQKVSHVYEQRVTPTVAWVGSLALVLVFAVNIWVISGGTAKNNSATQLHPLALFPNNSLYE